MFTNNYANGRWVCNYWTNRLQVSASGQTFVEAHTAMMLALADKLCNRKTIDG